MTGHDEDDFRWQILHKNKITYTKMRSKTRYFDPLVNIDMSDKMLDCQRFQANKIYSYNFYFIFDIYIMHICMRQNAKSNGKYFLVNIQIFYEDTYLCMRVLFI